MLRFAEELILLLLDKETGEFRPGFRSDPCRCALAGAVLMDLAIEDRIDTDLERLFPVDSTPVGDDLIDPWLRSISRATEIRDAAYWIDRLAEPPHADQVRRGALDRLVERGIVERESGGLLSVTRRVVRSRRYPQVDGEAGREVELRIMTVLFSEGAIPGPRDVMLIALVNACGIFERLLSPGEVAEVRDRIELICKMDLIARTVFTAIRKAGVPGIQSRSQSAAVPKFQGGSGSGAGRHTHSRRGRAADRRKRLPHAGRPGALARPAISGHWPGVSPPRVFAHFHRPRRAGSQQVPSAPWQTAPPQRRILRRHGPGRWALIGSFSGWTAPSISAYARVWATAIHESTSSAALMTRAKIVAREIGALPDGRPVTALPILRRIIAKQIGLLCAGVNADEYMPDLVAYLDRMIAVTTMRRPVFTMRTPRMRRARARVEALCEQVVRLHEAERPGGAEPDLIDDVLALHRADPQFLPETELVSACIGPFIAGLHTEASVATCMLYALLKHPETMARMLPEADELFAGRGPTAHKLRAMDVTHRVAMETLRLYRVAPVLVRTVVNTFEFAGHVIPAGTTVMFATTVPHLLPEHFPEPELFDIDRYAPERAEHRVPGVYAPFGLGTHRCLGSGFAEVSLALTLASMLHQAEITMHPPNYRLRMNYSTVAAPKSSFKIVIARRHRDDSPPLDRNS